VSQFKNSNWWSLTLDNLFLAGQIHYFLPDISASLMHCMDVHKTWSHETQVSRRYNLQDRDVEPSRPRRSDKRLETETFKLTETTSLLITPIHGPGWVDLGVWLHIEIHVPYRELNRAHGHPYSTNWARRRLTSLIKTNALPLCQTATLRGVKQNALYFAAVLAFLHVSTVWTQLTKEHRDLTKTYKAYQLLGPRVNF